MVLQTVQGHRIGEDIDDLKVWVSGLRGCPTVTHTLAATCTHPMHGTEPGTWFYVEGDPHKGIARRRCLACGTVRHVLDSESEWTFPPMWSCKTCSQSIAEVAYGVHAEPTDDEARVTWLAVAVRCAECGRFEGVTDLYVPHLTLDEVATRV